MGILDRFTDIIKANINDLLDKAEDPAKMIDQYLRELADNLAEVKEETAAVMAEEARTKRLYDANEAEVDHYTELARRALKSGNEGDARVFLSKKQELEESGEALKAAYMAAKSNAAKMRELHDKLVSDIEACKARSAAIKVKTTVAETQQRVNEFESVYSASADKAESAMDAFARMEAKADQMLDEANAVKELNTKPVDKAESLAAKYKKTGFTESVDAELEALKAELGM